MVVQMFFFSGVFAGPYPFMPHASHPMPADLSPGGAYPNSMLHNNISPGALNNYNRGPMVSTSNDSALNQGPMSVRNS